MKLMDIFNVIAGVASIISLIISIVSLYKVNAVEKIIKSKQNISDSNITGSSVTQVGGDYTNK